MSDGTAGFVVILLVLGFFLGFLVGMDWVDQSVDSWADEYCLTAGHTSGEWVREEGILCYDLNVYPGDQE